MFCIYCLQVVCIPCFTAKSHQFLLVWSLSSQVEVTLLPHWSKSVLFLPNITSNPCVCCPKFYDVLCLLLSVPLSRFPGFAAGDFCSFPRAFIHWGTTCFHFFDMFNFNVFCCVPRKKISKVTMLKDGPPEQLQRACSLLQTLSSQREAQMAVAWVTWLRCGVAESVRGIEVRHATHVPVCIYIYIGGLFLFFSRRFFFGGGSWFYTFLLLLLCFSAFLLLCFAAFLLFLLFCLSTSLLFCFSAFLLLCFSAFLLFLLLCLSTSLLFAFPAFCFSCFSAFHASLLLCFTCFFSFLLLCFPCFSAFVLLCLSTSTILLVLFLSHVFCCSTSCSFASLLPVFSASLFFSFLLLYSLLFVSQMKT